jgi:hypothetical protein
MAPGLHAASKTPLVVAKVFSGLGEVGASDGGVHRLGSSAAVAAEGASAQHLEGSG